MRIVTALSHVLPHRALSALARRLAWSRKPWLKQRLIDAVVRRFGVEAEQQGLHEVPVHAPQHTHCLAFFTVTTMKTGHHHWWPGEREGITRN